MDSYYEVNEPNILRSDVLTVGSGLIGAVYARSIIDSDDTIHVLMVDTGEQ